MRIILVTKIKENIKMAKAKVDRSNEVKIFISISKSLNIKMRKFRHVILSDRYNDAMIELIKLGLEKAKEDGVVEELKNKYWG